VVDDEMAIATTLAAVLRKSGFTCDSATSGVEAIRKAEDYPPDLIISDIVLPGMDGFSVTASIERQFPGCRVILMTGNPALAATAKVKYPPLLKPVNVVEVLRQIDRAC
jgi:DNA-binding response OmpR family regulator